MATAENEHAERFKTCVREMRARARDRVDPTTGAVLVSMERGVMCMHVCKCREGELHERVNASGRECEPVEK